MLVCILVHSMKREGAAKVFKLCAHSVHYCVWLLMSNLSAYLCELVSQNCHTVITPVLLKNPSQQFQINTALSQTVISLYSVWSKVQRVLCERAVCKLAHLCL